MGLVWFLDDGDVVEIDITDAGFVKGGDDAHRCTFARAVGSDEADDFAGGEGERHLVHCSRPAEMLFQMVDVNLHRFPRSPGSPRITQITLIKDMKKSSAELML